MHNDPIQFPAVLSSRNRTPQIHTRLSKSDFVRFDTLCRIDAKTRTELTRDALLYYMDAREARPFEEQEKSLAKLIRSQTDRLAGLLVRIATDLGMIIYLMYRHMVEAERDEVMRKARDWSVKRLRHKLASAEAELKQSLSNQAML